MTKIDERLIEKRVKELKACEERFIALATELQKINEEFNVDTFADDGGIRFHLRDFEGVVVAFEDILSDYKFLPNRHWEVRFVRKGKK